MKRARKAAAEIGGDVAYGSRQVYEALETSSEALLGLSSLATQGASGVGRFSLQLDRFQRSSSSGPEPCNGISAELLPIPIMLARPYLVSRCSLNRRSGEADLVEATLEVLAALNFLYCVGWTDHPMLPPARVTLGPSHERTLWHLWQSVDAFMSRGVIPFSLVEQTSALRDRAPDYAGGTVSVRRKLIARKVIPAWPKVGKVCVAPIQGLVDEALRAELDAPDSILLPESEWPAVIPKSTVHATDDEWYQICCGGYERSMFVPFREEDIFQNNLGEKVTNGAMGIDKMKEIDGVKVALLRFICIFTPINAYMRQLFGDSWSLPQGCLLTSLILGDGEFLWQDGEDLESCFNLFTLPDTWLKYFVFSKKVAATAFGGAPGKMTHVAMRAVPMGWINSVALLRNLLRNLLFKTLRVDEAVDVNPRQRVIDGDALVGCMDGADYFTRLKVVHGVLQRSDGGELPPEGVRHPVMKGFVNACEGLGLPINHGKQIIQEFHNAVLGGEMDGIGGVLRVAPEKSHGFVAKTCALLAEQEVTQVACQHWAGLYCFEAGFRRPLFAPMAFTNLRA